ncbi:thioredoxin family protein [Macrolepiota fuliginosa MF-IS2]|uniref:Thioredoxin family protein n=1 Tax=Macrolepiota fuliginosa MF-IS2 TaxID=1400762 RepID=A0A9P5X9Q5_9AGAR|nr:thioredoxin family protein [Macrolepiota fuliginosa MF-IS2]
MSAPVKLYVYDLSNGMARSLSVQLTGRQIDGIWHTSIVVFGREIFYGQGVNITGPGQSHHGRPLQIIDMGETAIDKETFNEYLEDIREHYTADKVRYGSDFNCNSFTNDVVGFLTGGSIPDFIKDLPSDFLSTPFGAALRPTIDAMYRRPVQGQASIGGPAVAPAPADSQLAASLVQSVANRAQAPLSAHPTESSSITAPMHVITNPASFNSFLKSHRAAAAIFTSQTCPPCRMIEPIFERLAEEKGPHDGRQGVAFAKVDIDVGLGRNLAAEWNIRATPTFYFFLDGHKVTELKGVDAAELRAQIDLLIYEAYPPHPHTRLGIPIIQKMSLNPILFTQLPAVDNMVSKFFSFIDEVSWPPTVNPTPDQIKSVISKSFAPYLKARFTTPKALPNGAKASAPLISSIPALLQSWSQVTAALMTVLPADALFPLADMWRLAFLDPATGSWATAPSTSPSGGPIGIILPNATEVLESGSSKGGRRNFLLTVLRLLCNSFSSPALGRTLLTDSALKPKLTSVLVQSLLHEDASIRTAAASLAFNVGAWLQNGRVEAIRNGRGIQPHMVGEDEEWQVELISAIVEALSREVANEEIVHRLTASLALFLRLSPFYDEQLKPLLEVLQAQEKLQGKLRRGDGWEGDGGVGKKEVRQLIEEVVNKLCV